MLQAGMDVLDCATSEIVSGSKLGIDAAKKLPGEDFKRSWPAADRDGCGGEGEGGKATWLVASDVSRIKLPACQTHRRRRI